MGSEVLHQKAFGGYLLPTYAIPWQPTAIPGPEMANVITKPAVVAALIKRAKNPLFIVGTEVLAGKEGEEAIDFAKRFSKIVPTVVTGHLLEKAKSLGLEVVANLPAFDIINRLKDPEWKGVNSKGPHDVVAMMGILYYYESQLFSTLKHFAVGKHMRATIALDRYYQPNATWSFPNLSKEDWVKSLEEILKVLEGGG